MKYQILYDQQKVVRTERVYRIRAVTTFRCQHLTINAGDLGGWVSLSSSLSQDGQCWIADDAVVRGRSTVSGNALLYNLADVSGYAHVYGGAAVYRSARVSGHAKVGATAEVYGTGKVLAFAEVSGAARVCGNAHVSSNARVYGDACVTGEATVSGEAEVGGDALIRGQALVGGTARVRGSALIEGKARISQDAVIDAPYQVLTFGGVGNDCSTLTVYRMASDYGAQRGCFDGTVEEFLEAVKERHGDNAHARYYKSVVPAALAYMAAQEIRREAAAE